MKNKIKKILSQYPWLFMRVKNLVGLKRKFFASYKSTRMLQGELNFFKAIFNQIDVLVDVGARFDTDYIDISSGTHITYYLFEINPKFYQRLKMKLERSGEKIILENLAVGERDGFTEYFEDSQSVLRTTTAIVDSKMKMAGAFEMIRLETYLTKKGVKQVDFLKTDIEEYDYFALVGLGAYLTRCKYIQFELGIGAEINDGKVTNDHYFNLLEDFYNLYILADENNPIWKQGVFDADLVILDDKAKKLINHYQIDGVGFNIVGINKKLSTDISTLKVASIS